MIWLGSAEYGVMCDEEFLVIVTFASGCDCDRDWDCPSSWLVGFCSADDFVLPMELLREADLDKFVEADPLASVQPSPSTSSASSS